MFDRARLKLTAWYLLIITVISILFSIAFYRLSVSELERLRRLQTIRQEVNQNGFGFPVVRQRLVPAYNPTEIDQSERRLRLILLAIDVLILSISGLAGFFLAGRTLKPIQEMMEEQNRFITDASHELRTPLTALKSEIEVSLRDKSLKLAEAKDLLKSNLEEVNSLQALSDGLINLTQYKRNQLVFQKISLKEIADEAQRKVSTLAKNKEITLSNKVKDDVISGNKQMLIELLVILLDNAVKYSPEKTTVKLNSIRSDSSVELTVADQGIGISKSDQTHLFDRFFRADKSRTKDTPGYGLGLSIAKEIVAKHNGHIKVDSEEGRGTTFIVQLPAK